MKNIKFKQFIKLQRGFDLTIKDMEKGIYPVIGSTKIIGYHNKYKKDPLGVVTGRSGTLGCTQIVNKKYWPHNTTLWVKDFEGNNPYYVYFYLKTINLMKFNSGASVPTLNRNLLDNLEIRIHSIFEQKKIASILSAYEQLIENNNRRIEILEEIAETIYKEWFVRFRFPGHEKVKMVDSELGKIPEGWEITDVYSLVEEKNTKNDKNEKLSVVSVTNKRKFEYSSEYFTKRVYSESLKKYKIIQKNEFAFNPARINIGSIAMLEDIDKAIVSPMYSVFRAKNDKIIPLFLWKVINRSSVFEYIKKLCFGTVRQIFKIKDFSLVYIALPPLGIQKEYEEKALTNKKMTYKLKKKNKILENIKNILLLKLISGKIDVSDLDIKIEDIK